MINLSTIEQERYNNSITLISLLFSQEKRNEVKQNYLDRVSNVTIKKSQANGEEGAIELLDNGTIEVEYLAFDEKHPINSYHRSIHELLHVLGVRNKMKELEEGEKDYYSGLQIEEKKMVNMKFMELF